jgi:hypothetical protein
VAGSAPPIADRLKWIFPDRWVRFHTLPESKRYPDTGEELSEILDWHNRLLNEIAKTGNSFWLITVVPEGTDKPARRAILKNLRIQSIFWRTLMVDDKIPTAGICIFSLIDFNGGKELSINCFGSL